MSFTAAFDNLIQNYIDQSTKDNMGLLTYFDEDWQSPCLKTVISKAGESSIQNDELVSWQPILRQTGLTLSNLESALEITIPEDLHRLFCAYYSHDINAEAPDGDLVILQAWNENDFDRLQKNLIAHVLMKRRLKQADTLFFALTDQDDIILSIDLATQHVMAEVVGKEPHKKIANNLAEFMLTLRPKPVLVSL